MGAAKSKKLTVYTTVLTVKCRLLVCYLDSLHCHSKRRSDGGITKCVLQWTSQLWHSEKHIKYINIAYSWTLVRSLRCRYWSVQLLVTPWLGLTTTFKISRAQTRMMQCQARAGGHRTSSACEKLIQHLSVETWIPLINFIATLHRSWLHSVLCVRAMRGKVS